MRKTAATVTAAGVCLLGVTAAGIGSALADPSGTPTYRQYVAVGSDTTEAVMDGMANVVNNGATTPVKNLGSYDASNGASPIQTRGAALNAATAAGATSFTTEAQIVGAVVGDSLTVGTDSATLAGTVPTAAPWTYTVSAGLASAHAVGDLATDTRCTFNRPVGSGAGQTTLHNSINNLAITGQVAGQTGGSCIDIARSSAPPPATGTFPAGEMTFVPFAMDAVTFATLGTSSVPRQLSAGQLKSIYQCSYHGAGQVQTIKPLLPQSKSGTRGFFLGQLGLSGLIPAGNAANPGGVVEGTGSGLGSCVDSGSGPNQTAPETAGTGFIENNGTVLTDPANLVPFSVGQYIAQISGQQTNNLGRAALGAVSPATTAVPPSDARSGLYINPTTSGQDALAYYPFTRSVYNVVETARLTGGTKADAGLIALLSGTTSSVCKQIAIIQQFGFDPISNCGDTTLKNP